MKNNNEENTQKITDEVIEKISEENINRILDLQYYIFKEKAFKIFLKELIDLLINLMNKLDVNIDDNNLNEILSLFFNKYDNETILSLIDEAFKNEEVDEKIEIDDDINEEMIISIWNIVDAVIDVKMSRFNERFASIDEVMTIKKALELKIKEWNLNITFEDSYPEDNFFVANDVITKVKETTSLKEKISNKRLREFIYHEKFIHSNLVESSLNRIMNSMNHLCSNCKTECDDSKKDLLSNTCCSKWSHYLNRGISRNISEEDVTLVEDMKIYKKV